MFINYTNHPSDLWDERQLTAAKEYGEVLDIPFVNVSPTATTEEVERLAEQQVALILSKAPDAVLCQGEMTLTYHMVRLLKKSGIRALCACCERITTDYVSKDGQCEKRSVFKFISLREY